MAWSQIDLSFFANFENFCYYSYGTVDWRVNLISTSFLSPFYPISIFVFTIHICSIISVVDKYFWPVVWMGNMFICNCLQCNTISFPIIQVLHLSPSLSQFPFLTLLLTSSHWHLPSDTFPFNYFLLTPFLYNFPLTTSIKNFVWHPSFNISPFNKFL